MDRSDRNRRIALNVLLAALFMAAQLGASVHAYDHEFGAPQAKVCKTCIGFDQTATGSVDLPHDSGLEVARARPGVAGYAGRPGTERVAVRQRGPPGAFPNA